ncbi:thioredoxin-like domain-containing protein, partial [Kineococcus glutinatus]|uniref:thioredoxin-like domain-containing protein n=1 Tax=Kineococcus glutinatus TaxID=1070872 RepID=UPI0031E6CFB8
APALRGGRWLGTPGGAEPPAARPRGAVVLLDFFTGGCVNCLHVLDELRGLEARFGAALTVLGVHSPKFPHEADPAAVESAVARLGVDHPVLDDAALHTWRAYAVRAWPTLVVVDPAGYVAGRFSGEGHAGAVAALVAELLDGSGAADPGPPPPAPLAPAAGLRFPSAALPLPSGALLVADTGAHRLVEFDPHTGDVLRGTGSGARGLRDGDAAAARFSAPRGLALLPPDVAAACGWDVVVADTGNHALRGVRLADGSVRTVAGTGRQLRRREGGGPALEQDLASPWDVAWFDGQVVVAMAGTHQLWAFDPAPEAARGVVRVLAGTTAEGLRDGPAELAWLAQPSGLAAEPGGAGLWFVDAETSALRRLARDGAGPRPARSVPVVADDRMANAAPLDAAGTPSGYEVVTAVGLGLFDSGLRDGPGRVPEGAEDAAALLQHPEGVALAPDGAVLVADTYNGAVRRWDPAAGVLTTLRAGLAEPTGVLAVGGELLVVESAAHRVVRLPPPGGEAAERVLDVVLAPGEVRLAVRLPAGQRPSGGEVDGARLAVAAEPAALLGDGAGEGPGLHRALRVADGAGGGVLRVVARVVACAADGSGAACTLRSAAWLLRVRLAAGAPRDVVLDLPAG